MTTIPATTIALTNIKCPYCGMPHNLEDVEPAFARPDAFLLIPRDKRDGRARHSDEGCILASVDGHSLTYYIRSVLHVQVRGEHRPIGWGVWVEVDPATYMALAEHLEGPRRGSLGPFPAALANTIPHYPDTLGLPGSVQPTGPSTRPLFRLAPGSEHPFVKEATEGVLRERAMGWRLRSLHPLPRRTGI